MAQRPGIVCVPAGLSAPVTLPDVFLQSRGEGD